MRDWQRIVKPWSAGRRICCDLLRTYVRWARLARDARRSHPRSAHSSAAYATAKLSFANVIMVAPRAGMDEEEIAHVTGLTAPMIRAVLRTP
jgi:hypothetical protein